MLLRSGTMREQDQPIHSLGQLTRAFPESLECLAPFDACALLDYPLHDNPGDHLLFIAALMWLSRQCDPSRIHIRHRLEFAPAEVKRAIGEGPVFFVGGGNLGDLWPRPQRFKEGVIRSLPSQPIVLLPQCMYFRDERNLERARRVFDAHPDLTIMLRDRVSLKMAREHFDARTVLAPDQSIVASELIPPRAAVANGRNYYLTRGVHHREASPRLKAIHEALSDWPQGGWECMGWQGLLSGLESLLRPSSAELLTVTVRSRLPDPLEQIRSRIDRAGYVLRSWSIIERCIAQLDPYEYVLTDRFHGHLLCVLRQIPHMVIGTNHHKVRAHWEAWTRHLPGVRFADSAEQVADQLRAQSPGGGGA